MKAPLKIKFDLWKQMFRIAEKRRQAASKPVEWSTPTVMLKEAGLALLTVPVMLATAAFLLFTAFAMPVVYVVGRSTERLWRPAYEKATWTWKACKWWVTAVNKGKWHPDYCRERLGEMEAHADKLLAAKEEHGA